MLADRDDAGRRLGERVAALGLIDPLVLGLPRGGVPVAVRVAHALHAPLDVIVVRKIGAPGQPELAIGAVAEGEDDERPVTVLNEDVVAGLHLAGPVVSALRESALEEMRARADVWRAGRPRQPLAGRTAVIVDDGIATGATALVACRAARERGARSIVMAVPVAPPGWATRFSGEADLCVALEEPRRFSAVGAHYGDFRQVGDDVVRAALGDR